MIRIFAHDPGYSNYGWAVVEAQKVAPQGLRFRVLENGLCHATVNQLKSGKILREQMAQYEKFLQDVRDKYKPDGVAAERFMTRGINGPSVEMVNFMLGVLVKTSNSPVKLMPAATWKNGVTRNGADLKEWYKFAKVAPHQLDACLIGVYTACQAYGIKDFGDMDLSGMKERITDQIEATTIEKLYNRKARK